jgi:hypothetical protein
MRSVRSRDTDAGKFYMLQFLDPPVHTDFLFSLLFCVISQLHILIYLWYFFWKERLQESVD